MSELHRCELCLKEFKTVASLIKHSNGKKTCLSKTAVIALLNLVKEQHPDCNIHELQQPLKAVQFIVREQDSILQPFQDTYIEYSDEDYTELSNTLQYGIESFIVKFIVLRLKHQRNIKPCRNKKLISLWTDSGWFSFQKTGALETLYNNVLDIVDNLTEKIEKTKRDEVIAFIRVDDNKQKILEQLDLNLTDYYKRYN